MYLYDLKKVLYQSSLEQYIEGVASIFDITGIGYCPMYTHGGIFLDNKQALLHDKQQLDDDIKQAYLDAVPAL